MKRRKKRKEERPELKDFFHPDMELVRFGTMKTEKVDWDEFEKMLAES